MNHLRDRLKKQGGFTMVELLIVVAIIAILVAVSIPMMNNALERSRHAVDQANIRDAVALAATKLLADEVKWGTKTSVTYDYVVKDNIGTLVEGTKDSGTAGVESQCECASSSAGDNATAEKGVGTGRHLQVTVTKATTVDGEPTVKASWTKASSGSDSSDDSDDSGG